MEVILGIKRQGRQGQHEPQRQGRVGRWNGVELRTSDEKGGTIVTVNPHCDGAVAHGKEGDRRREMTMLWHVRGSGRGADNDGNGKIWSRGATRRDETVDRVSGASLMAMERTGAEKASPLPMVRRQSR
jgi:hypothetical protein